MSPLTTFAEAACPSDESPSEATAVTAKVTPGCGDRGVQPPARAGEGGVVSKSDNGASAPMTPLQFVEKWKPVTLTERSAAQSHFRDLCILLDHPDPVKADPTGEWFTFEKGVAKSGGGDGFADVWKRDFFAWEYKKRKRNLDEALGQLARYALALENPPLHVACDTDRFRIVTAWTNTVPRSFDLSLDDILVPKKLDILRSVFYQPDSLKPGETRADLTKAAADKFSSISMRLQARGHAPDEVAHFVTRLVFLFFAEDVRLLPKNYFRRILREMSDRPKECTELLDGLFKVLQKGGRFGVDRLPHFNGGLFDDRPALPLYQSDVGLLVAAGSENWAHIDPTIFGTLFERLLDPDKRSQIGAHYTDATKIMMILEPVIFEPLKREWDKIKEEISTLAAAARRKGPRAKEWNRAEEKRSAFLERLRNISILDAACGSGNFLYLALQGIKNLEHSANQECETLGLRSLLPAVGPEIVRGIEINQLAAELARTTIWIGDIQWSIQNGIYSRPEPILRPLESIECRDALISCPPGMEPVEAAWPTAEFVVGNPPFLGANKFKREIGPEKTKALRKVFSTRVPQTADLVCYWFEKVTAELNAKNIRGFGLVATSAIRAGNNLKFLDNIWGRFFPTEAWDDLAWTVDGTAVRVSIVCGSSADSDTRMLNGISAARVNSDLTNFSFGGFAKAQPLSENSEIAFQGSKKVGDFEIEGPLARSILQAPLNVNGRSNVDVISRSWLSTDFMSRDRDFWIIDFGVSMDEKTASEYEAPFEHIVRKVKSKRISNARQSRSENWWRHGDPQPAMRSAIAKLNRYIVTPEVTALRLFFWADSHVLPDCKVMVIARDDDVTFGILSSRFHLSWSNYNGGVRGEGRTYTPSTTFETFPFPEGLTPNILADVYANEPRAIAISHAARHLVRRRNAWLNPPDLVRSEPEVVAGYPDRIVARDALAASTLRERTPANLYKQHPQWLIDAHNALDAAVAAAYGWASDISEEDALARLLSINLTRSPVAELPPAKVRPKRRSRVLTPEELRQSPQFKLSFAGSKKSVPAPKVGAISVAPPRSAKPPHRRKHS